MVKPVWISWGPLTVTSGAREATGTGTGDRVGPTRRIPVRGGGWRGGRMREIGSTAESPAAGNASLQPVGMPADHCGQDGDPRAANREDGRQVLLHGNAQDVARYEHCVGQPRLFN